MNVIPALVQPRRHQPGRTERTRRRLARGERGAAAVELALLLPLLAMITFGVIDFARVMYAYITVAGAAHETVMYLAENTTADLPTLQGVAAAEAMNQSNLFLRFTGTPNTTVENISTTLASGTVNANIVRVRVRYTFRPITPFPLRGPIFVSAVASAPRPRALT